MDNTSVPALKKLNRALYRSGFLHHQHPKSPSFVGLGIRHLAFHPFVQVLSDAIYLVPGLVIRVPPVPAIRALISKGVSAELERA